MLLGRSVFYYFLTFEQQLSEDKLWIQKRLLALMT